MTVDGTPDLTATVRAALAAATPGPWHIARGDHAWTIFAGVALDRKGNYFDDSHSFVAGVTPGNDDTRDLIAAAPSWLSELCDKLDAAIGERDAAATETRRLRDALDGLVGEGAPLDEPCRHDHHGYCQSHYLGHPCCVAVAKAALEAGGG